MTPVLETPRLRLRPHRVEDFEALANLWADPAVTRFIGKPSTREESWARLLRYGGLWPLLGFGYWAVEDRETGAYLGDVGFADFHRALDPAPPALPEIGWVLAPAAHGRGLATEAAARLAGQRLLLHHRPRASRVAACGAKTRLRKPGPGALPRWRDDRAGARSARAGGL